ncbi:hypothetical protein Q9290_01750 [Oceanimonas sp. CHS3-5]|uniref:hypothetical protein n=1 Tax=Oceanimonas sp. CHS3-5 TaxID=3068186 RepID=UPI00273E56D5|nr:hypothetical protein [Oceanimonas sp. CHS3-5]MDP5291021.1 hypothetical protein [Oceanimonas sp. CHS3-5]
MFPVLRLWPVLLLAGCAQVSPLISKNTPPAINENSPGVTVTRDAPPRLAALTFFATTAFDEASAGACTKKLLQEQEQDAGIIRYSGRDMLNSEGRVDNRTQVYGVLPVQDRIRFELTLLAKVSGTTYGFRRIESARHDPLGLNGHDYAPLPPSGTETQQVYQRLQRLFKELNDCIQGKSKNNNYGARSGT